MDSTLLLPFLISSSLLIAGCAKKAEESPAAQVENSVPESDNSTEPNEPALPAVDYWKPLASHLAGNYSANCMLVSAGPKRSPVAVTIAPDGKYKFGDHVGDLRTSELVMFNRSHEDDGSIKLMFTSAAEKSGFSLMTGEKGQGYIANYIAGESDVTGCDPAPASFAMASKPMYIVLASVLDMSARKINCTTLASLTRSPVNYEFKNGVITLGDRKYDLSRMNELVNISEKLTRLTYNASLKDNGGIVIGLDEHGQLMMVMEAGKDNGPMRSCSKE